MATSDADPEPTAALVSALAWLPLGADAVVTALPDELRALAEDDAPPLNAPFGPSPAAAEAVACTCASPVDGADAAAEASPPAPSSAAPFPPVEVAAAEAEPAAL